MERSSVPQHGPQWARSPISLICWERCIVRLCTTSYDRIGCGQGKSWRRQGPLLGLWWHAQRIWGSLICITLHNVAACSLSWGQHLPFEIMMIMFRSFSDIWHPSMQNCSQQSCHPRSAWRQDQRTQFPPRKHLIFFSSWIRFMAAYGRKMPQLQWELTHIHIIRAFLTLSSHVVANLFQGGAIWRFLWPRPYQVYSGGNWKGNYNIE